MTGLPPAGELIALVRKDGPAVLDAYAPQIDELGDLATVAEFLGITYASARTRSRRAWPKPDAVYARSPVWAYRTLVLSHAAAPGRGAPGRGRRSAHVTEAGTAD